MPRLPIIKAQKLIRVLKKTGFIHDRTAGSHYIFYHPKKKITLSVPVHRGRDLGRGITKAILEDAEISVQDFLRLI